MKLAPSPASTAFWRPITAAADWSRQPGVEKGVKSISNVDIRSTAERHAALTWAQRLKRVFNIGIELCVRCGGSVRVTARIEDQDVIPGKAGRALDRILAHLHAKEQNTLTLPHLAPPTRAPPETLALFVGNDSSTTALHQQGSKRKPHGMSCCVLSLKNEQI